MLLGFVFLKKNVGYIMLVSQNNPHRLTLVMKPDENFNKNCHEIERSKLEERVKDLTDEQKINIYETGMSSSVRFCYFCLESVRFQRS